MEDTNQLIRILASSEASLEERKEAALMLGKRRERDSLDALLNALENDSKELKLSAIWSLGELLNYNAFRPLRDLYYQEQDIEIRLEILKALGKTFRYEKKQEFSAVIGESLNSGDPELRKYSAYSAGKHDLEELSEPLENLFEEESDREVKALIVYSLGELLGERDRLEVIADASRSKGLVRQTAEQELENTSFYGDWVYESEEWFFKQLEHENEYVRGLAIKGLSKSGGYDDEFWDIALSDRSEQVRTLALKNLDLSNILDQRDISQRELLFFANRPSAEVRKEIAYEIGYNFLESGRSVLLRLIDDEDSGVRTWAVNSLRMIEEYQKFPAKGYINPGMKFQYDSIKDFGESLDQEITFKVLDRLHNEEDNNVVSSLIRFLGVSGEQQAFEPIRQIYIQNYNVKVRKASIKALSKIGQDTEQLERFLYSELEERKDPELRHELLAALGNIKDQRTVEFLIEALKENDSEYIERSILNALANINTEEARKVVEEREGDSSGSDASDYIEYQNNRIYRHLSNFVAKSKFIYSQNRERFERKLRRKTWFIRRRIPKNPVTTFLKKGTWKLLEISFNLLLFLFALIIFALVVGALLNILF